MKPLNVPLQIGMSTNYLETLKMMVKIGLGWSLLPEIMIQDDSLRPLDLENLHLSRSLGIVSHPNRTLSNAARTMRETCLKSAETDGSGAHFVGAR